MAPPSLTFEMNNNFHFNNFSLFVPSTSAPASASAERETQIAHSSPMAHANATNTNPFFFSSPHLNTIPSTNTNPNPSNTTYTTTSSAQNITNYNNNNIVAPNTNNNPLSSPLPIPNINININSNINSNSNSAPTFTSASTPPSGVFATPNSHVLFPYPIQSSPPSFLPTMPENTNVVGDPQRPGPMTAAGRAIIKMQAEARSKAEHDYATDPKVLQQTRIPGKKLPPGERKKRLRNKSAYISRHKERYYISFLQEHISKNEAQAKQYHADALNYEAQVKHLKFVLGNNNNENSHPNVGDGATNAAHSALNNQMNHTNHMNHMNQYGTLEHTGGQPISISRNSLEATTTTTSMPLPIPRNTFAPIPNTIPIPVSLPISISMPVPHSPIVFPEKHKFNMLPDHAQRNDGGSLLGAPRTNNNANITNINANPTRRHQYSSTTSTTLQSPHRLHHQRQEQQVYTGASSDLFDAAFVFNDDNDNNATATATRPNSQNLHLQEIDAALAPWDAQKQ